MKKYPWKIILLLCLTVPAFVSAQSNLYNDTAKQKIATGEFVQTFTKVEIIPSVNGGINALTDSLSIYLKNKNAVINGQAEFVFIVTKDSQVLEIEKVSGQISSEEIFKEGLLTYSNMWLPALQNSRKVSAYVRLKTKFKKDVISLKIIPYSR